MQFESFHWLSHHGMSPYTTFTKMATVCVIFWAFLFLLLSSFLYFGGVFNKTIIPLALVRYEMITATRRVGYYHLISNARSWNNC